MGLMGPGGNAYRKITVNSYAPSSGAYVNINSYNKDGKQLGKVKVSFNNESVIVDGIEVSWYGGSQWRVTNSGPDKVTVLSGLSGAPVDVEPGGLILSVVYTNTFALVLEKQ